MAVRYSGNVELRLKWNGRAYEVSIRAPFIRGRGVVDHKELGLTRKAKQAPSSQEMYDEVARRVLQVLERRYGKLPVNRRNGKVSIDRVFVSPCPQRKP